MNAAKLPQRAFAALRDMKRTNARERRMLMRAGLLGQQRVDRKSVRFALTQKGVRLQAIVVVAKTGWTRLRWLLSPKGRYVPCFGCAMTGNDFGLTEPNVAKCPRCNGVGHLERSVV